LTPDEDDDVNQFNGMWVVVNLRLSQSELKKKQSPYEYYNDPDDEKIYDPDEEKVYDPNDKLVYYPDEEVEMYPPIIDENCTLIHL
jgi:hypothetical protein